MSVLQHIHRRKSLAPWPHPKRWIRTIDMAAYLAGIIGPAMTLPQLARIYIDHQAAGISAVSWFSWMLLDIPFIIYGIVHKDKLIIMTYTAWFFLNLLVGVGAVIYG